MSPWLSFVTCREGPIDLEWGNHTKGSKLHSHENCDSMSRPPDCHNWCPLDSHLFHSLVVPWSRFVHKERGERGLPNLGIMVTVVTVMGFRVEATNFSEVGVPGHFGTSVAAVFRVRAFGPGCFVDTNRYYATQSQRLAAAHGRGVISL